MYLGLALSGRANCLVSGDKDLLSLHPFGHIVGSVAGVIPTFFHFTARSAKVTQSSQGEPVPVFAYIADS